MAGLFSGFELGGFSNIFSTFGTIIFGLILFVVIVGIGTIFVIRKRNKAQFNIPLIIITPRSDGKVVEINRGIGGYFKSKKIGGITSFRVKRKGIGTVEIPPPPSTYLSAPDRTLILAQKGVDDYEPVLPESLGRVSIPSGEKIPILNLKARNQDATAWAFDNEESAKKRFTIYTFWDKYKELISMMFFIFVLFLIMYINWIGMKDVVEGLAEVAKVLKQGSAPIITSAP